MSAEILREAAALMRERAGAADPSPWKSDASVAGDVVIFDATGKWLTNVDSGRKYSGGVICFDHEVANGAHIASWHPTVALAVAEWLERIAWTWELDPDLKGRVGGSEALAVATAYLNTPKGDDQ